MPTTLELIEELKASQLDIQEQLEVIQAKADAEGRDLLEDEAAQCDQLFAAYDRNEEDIKRRERIEAQNKKLATPAGTKADKQEPRASAYNFQPRDGARPRVDVVVDKNKHGFNSFGEFASSVMAAAVPSGGGSNLDPRLVKNAPTTLGTEGIGADGGFAVPPDFREAIMEKVAAEDSLLGRTDQMFTTSNAITFPKDETTSWQSSGGIQVYWEGENDQLSQSKPNLKSETVKANKLTALVPVTEELLDDAPSLDGYLSRKTPEKMDFAINNAIINGTGVGKPQGILNSNCLITAAKDTSTSPVQPADTIRYRNILAMWTRLYRGSRANAVWLINQDIEEQLYLMQFQPGSSTPVPVYLPPGGASASPYGTLMGRPVIPTEACQTLGDKGDIILADLSQYMTVQKTTGIRQDVSIHLWFDYDTTAFRFIFRIGGQPWWSSAIDPLNGSATRSCFVTLAERA